MASKAYLAKKDRESKEQIAALDRNQSDVNSKRQLVSNIIGSAIGGLGRIGSASIGGAFNTANTKRKIEAEAARSSSNDSSWYKQWVKDVTVYTNLPQWRNVKIPLKGTGIIEYAAGSMNVRHALPGIMSIRYIPYLGINVDRAASGFMRHPINVALARDISQIRKANSRSVSRNPDELGFYWLACTEIAALLSDLKSALELALHYDGANTYLPRSILAAKGWDYNVVYNNRAELKKLYQDFALRFNSNLVIPSDFSLLKRRIWLTTVVVKDANLRLGQLYTFSPRVYLSLNADEDKLIPSIADFAYGSTAVKFSVATLRTWLNNAFSVLEESVSITDLVSDIRSAIPESKFAKLPLDIENVAPVFAANDEVLEQIHNLLTLPLDNATVETALSEVRTDGTYLVQSNFIGVTFAGANLAANADYVYKYIYQDQLVMDSYNEHMDSDRVLTSTRLKFTGTSYISSTDANTVVFNVQSSGTELVTSVTIYEYNYLTNVVDTISITTIMANLSRFTRSMISAFDWHPVIYDVTYDANTSNTWSIFTNGEFGNSFSIMASDLAAINDICVESECYLPDATFTAAFGK